MTHIDRILRLAQKGRVFPGAVLLVSREGRREYVVACGHADLTTGQLMTPYTVFDLASLTKPLATALTALKLVQAGKLSLDQPIGDHLQAYAKTDKASITIRQLLNHTGGLPDYRPYFKKLSRKPASERKKILAGWIADEPLDALPGTRTIYSDLGFLLLQWVIESAAKKSLDLIFREEICRPLRLEALFFSKDRSEMTGYPVAATEYCAWRGRLIKGEVHDENAYCLGGVAGHAGLFGTAAGVEQLLLELLSAWHGQPSSMVFDPESVRRFLSHPPDGGRALGFDVSGPGPSSSGCCFSFQTVGHLGFTGTSFWMDLERSLLVILLTNRVHPNRDNEKVRAFRPFLHDAIIAGFSRC